MRDSQSRRKDQQVIGASWSKTKVPVRRCLFLRTHRDDFFDEPGRLITVHTLSIPILQLSDILLREINFQCVLKSELAAPVNDKMSRRSHRQERVAEQKS